MDYIDHYFIFNVEFYSNYYSAINDLFDNLNFNFDYIASDLITISFANHFKYNRFGKFYDSMYTSIFSHICTKKLLD